MMKLSWAILPLLLIPSAEGLAYDNNVTHPALTQIAVARSVLANPNILSATLGIDVAVDLYPNDDGHWQTVRRLIPAGAYFEDAIFPIAKFLFHFFNPNTEQGLAYGYYESSPNWALEDERSTIAGQEYSLRDFRSHLSNALAGASASIREREFGRAFRSIGHVVHHVEDMAQPQHTRDDAHIPGTEDGLYEYATKERFQNANQMLAAYGPLNDPSEALAYPIPRFPKARDYWTKQGKGLADYSYAGFVTTETNYLWDGVEAFHHPGYPTPEPVGPPIVMTVAEVASAFPDTPTEIISTLNNLGGVFHFYSWPVADEFTEQTTPNDFTTTRSIFAADLETHTDCVSPVGCPEFTLNRFNFYAANDLLLPRAIAYSAGLIDHALRGIAHPDGSPVLRLQADRLGSDLGILEIENTSDEDLTNGTLTIAYDRRDTGQRKVLAEVENVTIRAGDSIALPQGTGPGAVGWAELASNGPIDGEVTFFFRGGMGAEADGVAARVCECPGSINPEDPEDPANDCAGVCPCQYLGFQQGNPTSPGGTVITPTDSPSNTLWFGSDCETFGSRTRHFMHVDYPSANGHPPIHWSTFSTGMTATLFTPSTNPLARLALVFENPTTGALCHVNAQSEDGQPLTGATVGATTVLGPPLGEPAGPAEVAYPGTFASFSNTQFTRDCPIESNANLVEIVFAHRSGVQEDCCREFPEVLPPCDEYDPVPLDALMVCPGELAYPQ